MDVMRLNSRVLAGYIDLLEQRRHVLIEIDEVNAEMNCLEGGLANRQTGTPIIAELKKKEDRVPLKDSILGLLKQAGPKGMAIVDIAQANQHPRPKVSVWFLTTGKKIKEVKKVKRGCYAYQPAELSVVN